MAIDLPSKGDQSSSLFFFSVSKLSHFEFCPKRSKLEIFGHTGKISSGSGAIRTGNRLHYLYSYPNKGFDRVLLRARLNRSHNEFRKQIDNIWVIGHYDDLRVLRYNNAKFTSLVEVKTTGKKYMWSGEVRSAIRQLQLYMWLMKEELEKLGFPLWKRSYVEVFSQKTGKLIRRMPVLYDEHIEEWIRNVADSFRGLHKVSPPYLKKCRMCPRNVKSSCDWFIAMGGKLKVIRGRGNELEMGRLKGQTVGDSENLW